MTTLDDTEITFTTVVEAQLGAALEERGFSCTKAPEHDLQRVPQVVFCADFDMVAARLPGLSAPTDYRVGEGRCFDLVVEGSLVDGLVAVRMEGCPVDGAVLGSGDLGRDLSALRSTLARVFDEASC